MLLQVIEQSFLFFPLAMGVYLTYSILKTTDLTVDGSFVLGAAIFAKLVSCQVHPLLSLLCAMLGGLTAGLGVSLIQYRNRISPLIASILAVFILSSLNLIIMGRPNISLLRLPTLVNLLPTWGKLPLVVTTGLLLAGSLALLLNSRTGLILRAMGESPLGVRMIGKRASYYKVLGLMISNLLAAFCGAMSAQCHGYSDISMGFGMALIGIGTVAIGDQLHRHLRPNNSAFKAGMGLLFCFAAVFIYFFALNGLIQLGIDPLQLKMAVGFLLIACLAATGKRQGGTHAQT